MERIPTPPSNLLRTDGMQIRACRTPQDIRVYIYICVCVCFSFFFSNLFFFLFFVISAASRFLPPILSPATF